jgi:hypothetical protein
MWTDSIEYFYNTVQYNEELPGNTTIICEACRIDIKYERIIYCQVTCSVLYALKHERLCTI